MIHCHRHSEWSLLDGCGTAQQYAQEAARIGHPALALTDHGTLSGALHHVQACQQVGIMPIVGVEAYFRPDRLTKDKENKPYWHLVLLAKNMAGWRNLLRITSESYDSGFYHKPCVDWDLLFKYREGIIASTACISGRLCYELENGDTRDYLNRMRRCFGDDLFVEIMPHAIDRQVILNVALTAFAQQEGIPLISTCDAHYPYQDWADTQDVMLMMATGQTVDKRKAKKDAGEDVYEFDCKTLYLLEEHTVRELYTEHHPQLPAPVVDEAIRNTMEIVNRCDMFVISKDIKLPKIAKTRDEAYETVVSWCREGLDRIGQKGDRVYEDRLATELEVLESAGVMDYLVLVGNMVRWAKREGIRVGAGRGSAAGCLVSYLSGITSVDPIGHGLLFERFLNPHRKGLPDIDIDFQHDRRDEVKGHLGDLLGHDHVADIIAFQTFGPKSAIQNVSRIFGVPFEVAMKLTNQLQPTDDRRLLKIAESNEDFAKFRDEYPNVWKHATRIQGQVKAKSKHAAGVIVLDKPVTEYIPTERSKDGGKVTSWNDSAAFPVISDYGFVKIDVLATDGLTKQAYALDLIESRHGIRPDLDNLPVVTDPNASEPKVIEAFAKGMTLGVWQFSAQGITRFLREIKPDRLQDVIAANALFRPGPLEGGMANEYGERKHGRVPVTYFHPLVKPFLEETYGLLVYQEQVMQIVQELGGYTMAEADDIRKAMGKLYRLGMDVVIEFMEEKGYVQKFKKNAKEFLNDQEIDELWDMIIAFGGYGFNKSHSAAYAVQAYQDMWLKIHYPHEFYAALLTFDTDRVKHVMREARYLGVSVSPPDVNTSDWGFTLDKDRIRFGLAGVKNVGPASVTEIMKKRPFDSFEDMEQKIEKKKCNKKIKEALLQCGAFDCWGLRNEWPPEERTNFEIELLGVSMSAMHELTQHASFLDKRIFTEKEFAATEDGEGVVIGGEILRNNSILTKKGAEMCFMTVAYGDNIWGCVVFPDKWAEYKPLIISTRPVVIQGRRSVDNKGNPSLIVDQMTLLGDLVKALESESTGEPNDN